MKRFLLLFIVVAIPAYTFAATQDEYNEIKKDMEYIAKVKQQEQKELAEKNKQKIELPKRDMRYNFMTPTPIPVQIIK